MGPLPQEIEELSAIIVILPHPQRVNPEEMRERKKTHEAPQSFFFFRDWRELSSFWELTATLFFLACDDKEWIL